MSTSQARRLALVAAELATLAAELATPEAAEPDMKPQEPRTPDGDRLLTAEQVALALGLDVAAVSRRRFPFRVKLGRRTVRYSEAGLRKWMRNGGSP